MELVKENREILRMENLKDIRMEILKDKRDSRNEIIGGIIIIIVIVGLIIWGVIALKNYGEKISAHTSVSGKVESVKIESIVGDLRTVINTDHVVIEGKDYQLRPELHDLVEKGDMVTLQIDYKGLVDSVKK